MAKKSENTDSKKPRNVHKGHRERLRQRFLSEGLENFQDHNVLELLLFYSVPLKDTNEEAHNLIDTFGSLSSVFDASFEELCNVKGIGEHSATLIKIIPELFKKYEVDKINNDDAILDTSKRVAEYVAPHFKGVKNEKMYILCLDSNCRALNFTQVSEGIVNTAPLNTRKIMEIALKCNASSIILVHNHPSGIVAPSRKDIDATIGMVNLMQKVGLKISDHIIIGNGSDFFSFRKSDKYKYIFN
jgi:DNA repair protein RadC